MNIKYFQPKNIFYLILLSLPLYLIKFQIFNIPTTVLEIEIYSLAVYLFFNSALKHDLKKHIIDFIKNPFFIPWLLFFIVGVISTFVSPDRRTALGIFKAYFFDVALFLLLMFSIIKTKEDIKICFKCLIVSALALSLIGLAQYFFFSGMLQDGRIRSVFSSPNYLALYIAPIYFLSLLFIKKPIRKNLTPYLVSCIIVFCIILTYSRGAWLGLILGFVFLATYFIARKTKLKMNFIIPLIFIIGFVASFFFIIKGSYSFGLVPENRIAQSDNIRKEIWVTSIDISLRHWLTGIGLGNFQNYFGEYTKTRINYPEYITPNAVTPHNIFLNIWLQTGLLGILGLLIILGLFFVKCFRGLKKEVLINLILISAMIAILGQGLVDSAIWKNDLMIMFWFLVGSSYIINMKGEENNGK